jgi:hypothetical protein
MVLADANYKYVMIGVGAYGSNSDGGIFANCQFGISWLQIVVAFPYQRIGHYQDQKAT